MSENRKPYTPAMAEKNRRGRLRRIERGKADPTLIPHGTSGGRANWGCNCPACVAANTAEQRAYRARKRQPIAAIYTETRPLAG